MKKRGRHAGKEGPQRRDATHDYLDRYSLIYKLEILDAAEDCASRAAQRSLLRREGLTSAHLAKWRQQDEDGDLIPSADTKLTEDELEVTTWFINRSKQRLERKLRRTELIINIQQRILDRYGAETGDTEV